MRKRIRPKWDEKNSGAYLIRRKKSQRQKQSQMRLLPKWCPKLPDEFGLSGAMANSVMSKSTSRLDARLKLYSVGNSLILTVR